MTQGSVCPSEVAFWERCLGGGSGIRQEHQVQTREGEGESSNYEEESLRGHAPQHYAVSYSAALARSEAASCDGQACSVLLPNWKWCQMCVKAYLLTFAAIALCDPPGHVFCAGDQHNY